MKIEVGLLLEMGNLKKRRRQYPLVARMKGSKALSEDCRLTLPRIKPMPAP